MRAVALFGALTAVLTAGGCSDATGPLPDNRYVLVSIANDTVPITFDTAPGFESELLSQSLMFRSDGTYEAYSTARVGTGDDVGLHHTYADGTYRRSGNTLVLTSPGGASGRLEIRGDILTGDGVPSDMPGMSILRVHTWRLVTVTALRGSR